MKLKNISGTLLGGKRPFYLAWFVAGFLAALLVRQRIPVKFKEELDLLPLLQLGVTLIVALLITHYARQRADEQRAEKGFVIEQLRDFQSKGKEIFSEFSVCCDTGKLDDEQRRKLNRLMRELSNLLAVSRKAIEYFGDQPPLLRQWNSLQDTYYGFKASVTGHGLAVDLSNPKYRTDAQKTWRELEDQLLKLIFEVNKT
ncbi:MAG: hypothetical protein HYR56_03895 [Acidobacteria bacterium]|nr:hypothetical protein [Acidobacteriota bacterium]MBI3425728.1 hypothetical protein [Acidobacteriota bacterium]